MADTRAFNVYYANRTVLPGEVPIAGEEILVLRGGTVYRMAAAGVFAYASMTGNSDVTAIATIDVWVPVAGTLVEGDASANFTFAANEFTFNGVNQAAPQKLSAKITVSKAGGGDEIYEVGIFVNGTQVDTGMTVGAGTTLVGFVATDNTHTLQTGDVIDVRVRNISGTSDCTVTHAQLILGTLG
jgi:hypothetical protein